MSSVPATTQVESTAKVPRLETPKHGSGKLWRGYEGEPRFPVPGPGAPSKEAKQAKQAEAEALELAMLADSARTVRAALDAWDSGNATLLKDLKDRHWGTATQKVEYTLTADESLLAMIGMYTAAIAEVVPNAIEAIKARVAAQCADGSKLLAMVRGADGVYSVPASLQPGEDADSCPPEAP